jgi:hypothetical protein
MTTQSKIESLTPQQELECIAWRKRYFDIGWCTKRSDRPRAEKGITALYKRMKLPAPQFLWVNSPMEAVKIIKESTGTSVTLTGTDGNLDAYWAAFYTFLLHIGGTASADDIEHLSEWSDVIESTGPCYPYSEICIMTERPTIATYDERELLHGENAPALQYLDGYSIYQIHGIPVPEIIVMRPWDMTLEMIEAMKDNTDVQTIAQAAWCYPELTENGRHRGAGGGRWLDETGAESIHMDCYTAYTDEMTGEAVQLQRVLLLDKTGRKFLVCSDSSTPEVYYIQVDPNSKTCEEGHMSINGGIPDSKISVSS